MTPSSERPESGYTRGAQERAQTRTARHCFSITYSGFQGDGDPSGGDSVSLGAAPARIHDARNSQQTDPGEHPLSRQFEKNRFRLDTTRYLPDIHRKNLIVLHFTAGTSCESAYRTWQADPQRIATAYGVDPDGTIVEFFPPEAWAYHLGVKGTSQHDKRSIGIEIANVGPLQEDATNPDQLNWWPRNWGVPFCQKQDTHRYVEKSYRGMKYFAVMPPDQTKATAALVNYLCERFAIPNVASEEARQGEFNLDAFATYQGVASHSNFRRDKWDVGPAFPWESLGF